MLPPIHLLADVAGVVNVTDRTEVRTRSPGDYLDKTSVDVETLPSVTAVLTSHRTTVTLGYLARVSEIDANYIPAPSPSLFQTGLVALGWRTSRVELTASQSLGYGRINFAGPAALNSAAAPATPTADQGATGQTPGGTASQTPGSTTTTPGGTPSTTLNNAPVSQSPYTISSFSQVGTAIHIKKWALVMDVGYQLSGGASIADRNTLPIERGPRADATVTYAATRHDQVYTLGLGQRIGFVAGPSSAIAGTVSNPAAGGPTNTLVTLREGWRHLWTSHFSSDVNAGATLTESRVDDDSPNVGGVYPAARATLQYQRPFSGNQLTLALTGGTDATVDRILGTVDQRLDSAFSATLNRRRVSTHLQVFYTRSVDLDAPNAVALFFGEVGAAWEPAKFLTLEAGVRAGVLRQDARSVTSGQLTVGDSSTASTLDRGDLFQSSVYLAVTVRAPTVRF